MALPANKPKLTREEQIAAAIEAEYQEMLRLREVYPDPMRALGELMIKLVGDDSSVLSAASDECYYGGCDDDDDAR
ncbi:MAG: hypothetical protein QM692_00700 [Thermomicrobiales bacterium]